MMRRREKELKDKVTIRALLERTPVGRLATVNRHGCPVIKPVNFLYLDGKIYIHSSRKGEKIRDIRRGSAVCFELDEAVSYVVASGLACSANTYYRSIIVKGKAQRVIREARKKEILDRLMDKYQPEGGYGEMSKEILGKTAVIEIAIDVMTGRESLG